MKSGKGSKASRRESSTSTVEDVSHDDATGMASDQEGIARGGVATPFPWKLHEMLEDSAKEGNEWIVSWQSHGRSFLVHKPKLFVEKIMPTYFNQSKFASFQRQLNLYGFSRLTTGKDKGAYYHSCFIRGHRSLCRGMVRQKIKGTKVRRTLAPEEEPDFYKMTNSDVPSSIPPLPPLGGGDDHDPSEVLSESPVVERRSSSSSRDAYKTDVASAKERALKLRQDRIDAVRDALKQTEGFCDEEEAFEDGRKHMLSVPSVSPMDSEESDSEESIAIVTPAPNQMRMHSFPQSFGGNTDSFPVLPTFEEMTQAQIKGGDLLFFEGKPFHYLEHLDTLPPPPQAVATLPKAKQGPAQAYSYTPRDSLQSLMRADPQALMGAAFGMRYAP